MHAAGILLFRCFPLSPKVIHRQRLTLTSAAWRVLQILRFADRTGRHHMLGLDRFADHTSKEAWDYSAWVRVYSTYLDERLDVYR